MNKGLELIEAYHLFPVAADQLEVLVHPESVIHGMVAYKDCGSVSSSSFTNSATTSSPNGASLISTYSIGFGREIFGFNDRSGTRLEIRLAAFGRLRENVRRRQRGEHPFGIPGAVKRGRKKQNLHHKSLPKKAAIVAAGPSANFILTISVFTWFLTTNGLPSTEPVVGSVVVGSAAERAGLQGG